MKITTVNSTSPPLFFEQSEWLCLMDTIDIVYGILDNETKRNLRHGYGQTVGYPLIDKLATALEQFIEDNREMERVETDCFHTVEVDRVKDFIRYIRLAREIQVR